MLTTFSPFSFWSSHSDSNYLEMWSQVV